jgi:hypothetical protein
MKLKFTFLFVLLFTGSISIFYAQQPQMNFKVVGKVVENETNNSLEYVNVVIYSVRDSSMVSGSISQKDGSFSLDVNHPGKFYMVADFIGYKKNIIPDIVLKPGNFVYDAGTIAIKPEITGLEQVDVVADRPYVSYQLDKKVVEVALNPSAQGGTAVDALQNVPSVQTDIEGNVSIRGNSNFTVLIDGRQSQLSGSDALKQIPASAIDKIEIITNPSVKYDPDGTVGIINIISKKGKLNGHSAVINLSTGNNLSGGKTPVYSGDINYTYKQNKYSVTTGFSFRNSKNINYNTSDKDNLTPDYVKDSITKLYEKSFGLMQMRNITGRASIDYQLSISNTVSVGGEYSDFLFNRGDSTRIHSTFIRGINKYEKSYTESKSNPGSMQIKLGDRQIFKENPSHYLTVDFTYQKSEDKNGEDTVGLYLANSGWNIVNQADTFLMAKNSSIDTRYRVEVNYSNPISDNLGLEAGFTYRADLSDKSFALNERLINAESWNTVSNSADKANLSRYIYAGWAIVKGDIFTVKYSLGLRGEMTDQLISSKKDNLKYTYDSLVWYPSFSFSKEFAGGNEIQLIYSRRINRPWDRMLSPFPTISNGYSAFQPNPSLQPEYAGAYELNYQKSWGASFVSFETFYRKTVNKMERMLIPINDTFNVFTVKNLGYDKSFGGEAMANIKVAPWFILNASASLYRYKAEGNFNGENTVAENTSWESSFSGTFNLPTTTRIQLTGRYEGPQVEVGSKEDASYVFSASAKQDFFDRKLSATLRVEDIFNTHKHVEFITTKDTYSKTVRYRKSPMLVFSLSYRFNQQNGDKKRNGKTDDTNGNEGGMDMEY